MIRAVLYTNVYVAALLSREGSPARLMGALAEGLFDAVVCPRLVGELEGVLARPKIATRLSAAMSRTFVEWLGRVAVHEPDPDDVPSISADPDDDFLFALALASRAQVVVSGDAHVLVLQEPGIRTLSPAAFADLVESLR